METTIKNLSRALLLLVLLTGTGHTRLGYAAEVVDRIVAVVGTEIVLDSDLKAFAKRRSVPHPLGKLPLDELIREKLLLQEITKLGISVSDQELSEALQNILAKNRMTPEALRAELSAKGVPFGTYQEQVREQIKQMKFIGQVIYPRVRVPDTEINKRLKNQVPRASQASEEERQRVRQEIIESKITGELAKYLDEVRSKSYVEIKN